MTPNTIVLWDIDGTILTTGGAGEEALKDAIQSRFGERHDLRGIEIAGRTDKLIAMQLLRHYGQPETMENIAGFLDGYLAALTTRLPECQAKGGTIYPGVREIMEEIRLRRPHIAQGLLTGNLHQGAKLKLEHYNAYHYFEFGAFADDHHDRNQVSRAAMRRVEERFGAPFDPAKVFVVGDTPHDIACGRAISARTIAVATGKNPLQELAACKPDFLFADLSDTAKFFDAIDPAPAP